MAVSFINSLYADFGTGIVTSKTGVTLHNRGEGFVLDAGHRNCIAPRKRPMHTLVPAMVMRDGKLAMSFGAMGAHFQPMGHVYMMSNMYDYGMDPQEAIDTPRVFFEGDAVVVEEGVPAEVVEGLKARGHRIVVRDFPWGGGQAVVFDRENGKLISAPPTAARTAWRSATSSTRQRWLRSQATRARCTSASTGACRASASAIGPKAWLSRSTCRAGCATAATAASKRCSPGLPMR
jgi:gamma-glutamyltranspeptidase